MLIDSFLNVGRKYNKSIQNNSFITNGVNRVHNAVSSFLLKFIAFVLVIFLIGGAVYVFLQKASGGSLNIFAQAAEEQVFDQVLAELHSVRFDDLRSDRFQTKINDESAVCMVIMTEPVHMKLDMVGGSFPLVPNVYVTPQRTFVVRDFELVVDIQHNRNGILAKILASEKKNPVLQRKYFAVKQSDGGFQTVLASVFEAFYQEQVQRYRENLHQEALDYLNNRNSKK